MKPEIMISVAVFCYALNGVQSEWTGTIKTMLDKNTLTSEVVLKITEELFGQMSVEDVCLGETIAAGATGKNISSPITCDADAYNSLKTGVEKPADFNINVFLSGLWSSEYGKRLLNICEKTGIDRIEFQNAFKETWEMLVPEEDSITRTAFNNLFLGFPNNYDSRKFRSWYTYDIRSREEPKTAFNFKFFDNDLPQCVVAFGDSGRSTGYFLYPSHPQIDITLYTLCSWRSDNSKCIAKVPGNKEIQVLAQVATQNGSFYILDATVKLINKHQTNHSL